MFSSLPKRLNMKNYIPGILLVILMIIILHSCEKEETPSGGNKIEFEETHIDAFTSRARVSTALASTGGNTISQHGHCWSETTQYHIAIYAINKHGVTYEHINFFITLILSDVLLECDTSNVTFSSTIGTLFMNTAYLVTVELHPKQLAEECLLSSWQEKSCCRKS